MTSTVGSTIQLTIQAAGIMISDAGIRAVTKREAGIRGALKYLPEVVLMNVRSHLIEVSNFSDLKFDSC